MLEGASEAVEQFTHYFAQRSAFGQIVGQDATVAPATLAQHVGLVAADQGLDARLAPLLSVVTTTQIPDNDLTREMRVECANSTRENC